MCGIAGIVGFEDKALLKRMCAAIAHRGPDDHGFFFDKGVGLGHRRLSIIDLAGGHQPMSNEDGTVWVVFNGEIFNFRDMRRELGKKGHKFKTNSDTEGLVHAYEEYGTGFVKKLRGMFAFAIWDCTKRTLLLARDRVGINPIYYHVSENSITFASEIKAILQNPDIKRKVSIGSLNDYLTFQAAVGPDTLFDGVYSLLPGHMLVFERGNAKISKYWDITDFSGTNLSEKEVIERLLNNLKDAVKYNLESDVPVGIYLSGGVDSSTVLSLMQNNYTGNIHSYSVGFGYSETDELQYSRLAAEKFGTVHEEIWIDTKMVLKDIPEVVALLEDPMADSGVFANFYLSKELNRSGLKVVLSGAGGDELFAGYQSHSRMAALERARSILPPGLRKQMLPRIGRALRPSFPKSLGINTFIESLAEDFYMTNGQLFPTEYERMKLYVTEWCKRFKKERGGIARVRAYYLNNRIQKGRPLTRAQYTDLKVYVDEHMLHEDKMNLGHAVEIRYPLLDYKLAEFAFIIPEKMRIKNNVEKYIFRKAAQKLNVPKEIIWKKKKGFRSPLEHWLSGDMRSFAQDAIERSELIRKTMNQGYIKHLFRKTRDHWYAHKVWGLMVLALWYDIYFGRDGRL